MSGDVQPAAAAAGTPAKPGVSPVGDPTSSPAWPYWSGHYTVREGDTLSSLAGTFGVAKETLVACNESLSLAVEEPVAGIRIWKPRKGTAEGDPGGTRSVIGGAKPAGSAPAGAGG